LLNRIDVVATSLARGVGAEWIGRAAMRSYRSVAYEASVGKPVGTLFTITSPTTRARLHLMAKLSFTLRARTVRSAVRQQESRQDILQRIGSVEWSS